MYWEAKLFADRQRRRRWNVFWCGWGLLLVACLSVALAACGSNPTPPPPPPQPPAVFSGSLPTGVFAVTESDCSGSAAIHSCSYPNVDGTIALPQCANASTCWISYAEYRFQQPVSLTGRPAISMNYTLSASPDFILDCETPNNSILCNNQVGHINWPVSVRLLLREWGDQDQVTGGQAVGRAFSAYMELAPGTNTITRELSGNGFATEAALALAMARLGGIGFCFGGGTFDCHGIAVSKGSASFTVNSYTVQ